MQRSRDNDRARLSKENKSNTKMLASRRRLLQILGAGGGLASANAMVPQHWARPVVDAVMLPGHAQSSGTWYGVIDDLSLTDNGQTPGIFRRLWEKTLPMAYAGFFPEVIDTHICIGPNGSGFAIDIVLVGGPFSLGFSGILDLNAGLSILDGPMVGSNCGGVKAQLEAELNSIGENAIGNLRLNGGPITGFTIPMAPCDLPGLGSCVAGP